MISSVLFGKNIWLQRSALLHHHHEIQKWSKEKHKQSKQPYLWSIDPCIHWSIHHTKALAVITLKCNLYSALVPNRENSPHKIHYRRALHRLIIDSIIFTHPVHVYNRTWSKLLPLLTSQGHSTKREAVIGMQNPQSLWTDRLSNHLSSLGWYTHTHKTHVEQVVPRHSVEHWLIEP